jgi:protein TonB
MQLAIGTIRPRPVNIAANSAVIALHIIAGGLLLMPMTVPLGLEVAHPDTTLVWVNAVKKIAPLPTPKPVIDHHPKPKTPSTARSSSAVVSKPDTQNSTLTTKTDEMTSQPIAIQAGHATTKADSGPDGVVVLSGTRPDYPRDALRDGIQGEVLLLVSIDGQGHPTAVIVSKSSGDRRLDIAARKHVLAAWRFEATGHNQSATLPIRFKLN